MKLSFRWYGESDSIPLQYIRQIPGMRSIVSAVYDVAPGEVWPEESLARMKALCEENGLVFDVVESIPVSEDIKLGTEKRGAHLAAYCENIRRCAKYGVKCVTYNFMPVFDWTRTQLDKPAADGSTSLVMYWEQMKGLDPLKDDIHLPGWDSSYTQAEVRELITAYGKLGEEGLWRNLEYFLQTVIPVAEECGVQMAIHPDDPPYPIFGLPRIITCEANLDRMLHLADSPANCLCLCTGSLGCAASNDVPAMVRKYSAMGRIAFVHLRNVKILEDGSFEERAHLSGCGSLDMYEIVKALVETGFEGYVRPDHGRMIWGESGKPGYGLFDRALGAAYINGLFEACEKAAQKERRSVMQKNVLDTDLSGKVAVVTGAGGVLCSAFAQVLARAGAKVALLDLNEEAAASFAAEINAEGGVARAYKCNVLDKAACYAAADAVAADLGPCDILVNGAGGNNPRATTDHEYYLPGDIDADTKSFFDLEPEGVEFVFNLNFLGTLLPTQAFARQMVGRTGCNILNISSMNAYTPLTKIPAYSGAKAAVSNFTQWLAVHFSKAGIRVNAIAPGFFATKQNAALLFNPDGTPTARTGKILAATPMGRFGDAETELAGAVLFLLNEKAASFITGVCIPIDGGFSAYSGV